MQSANGPSYRGRYLPTPVPREHMRAILEAGLSAPSGCNKQTTSLIAVDDPALAKRLFEAIAPADPDGKQPVGRHKPGDDMCAHATHRRL